MAELSLLIRLRDEASAQLNKLNTDIESSTKSWNDRFRSAAEGIRQAGIAMLGIGGSITGVMGLSVKAAIEIESTKGAFENLANSYGQSANSILQALQKASSGTVAENDLMLSANRAMTLGVAKNTDQFTALMEIARDRAKAMGLTTTQAFDNIVTGIGRGSPLILDNLGLMINLTEANDTYAQSLGKTASELTEAEKQQALLNAVLEQGSTSIDKSAQSSMTTSESMQALKVSISDTAASIGAILLPVIKSIVEYITPVIENIKKWTDENPELTKVIVIVTAAVGALLTVLGTLAVLVPTISNLIKIWTAVQWLLNVAMSANPIGLIILAIGALIAIGVLLWQNWDTIRAKCIEIWNSIKDFFVNLWNNITSKVVEVWNTVKEFFGNVWNSIKEIFVKYWDIILLVIFPPAGIIAEFIKHWGAISKWFTDNVWEPIKNGASTIWEAIKETFKSAINWIIGLTENWVNGFISAINQIITALNSLSFDIPEWVPGIGGKSFGLNISTMPGVELPRLATGGNIASGGLALVGEQGAELLNLPQGASVTPLSNISNVTNQSRGGNAVNFGDIYITVEGSNREPQEIAETIRQELLKLQRRNANSSGIAE